MQVLRIQEIPRSDTISYWKVTGAPLDDPHKVYKMGFKSDRDILAPG